MFLIRKDKSFKPPYDIDLFFNVQSILWFNCSGTRIYQMPEFKLIKIATAFYYDVMIDKRWYWVPVR